MKNLRIGIDASRATAERRTGTENYSLHLIRNLIKVASEDRRALEFVLYFNRPPSSELFPTSPSLRQEVMTFPRLWTHLRLSLEMLAHPPDVLFVPAHVLPLVHPRRSVVTIHDLGYLYYPKAHRSLDWLYLYLSTRYNARSAAHIIADSEATKRDTIERLHIDATKISVVYPAASPEFQPMADANRLAAVRSRYGIEGDYILFVGTLHPRKNIARLVEAYVKLKEEHKIQARLVLTGKLGWLTKETLRPLERVKEGITLTGFVAEVDLPALLSGATAFVLPSLFEGFGLPVLEAMSCGTPVVAANSSSLPEVIGDAGVLVDPLSVDSIAEGIRKVVENKDLRAELREKGLAQALRFTWEEAARKTVDILEMVGNS